MARRDAWAGAVRAVLTAAVLAGAGHGAAHAAHAAQERPAAPRGDARDTGALVATPLPARTAPGAAGGEAPGAAAARVTLDVRGVPLGEVLRAIRAQSGAALLYGSEAVPLERPVTVRVRGVPVVEALREALRGTDVEVRAAPGGQLVLARRPRGAGAAGRAAPAAGAIRGRVRDAASGAAVAGAAVAVAGTRARATSGDGGEYAIAGVPAGDHRLVVRRIGYAPAELAVAVAEGGETVADVALAATATRLTEIVATATGDQRRVAVGNAITTIRADSVVAAAPVSTLSDLLTARAAGVQVFVPGGLTGASPQINVRGQGSISLLTQPILIVDGVRVEGSPALGAAAVPGLFPSTQLSGRGAAPTGRLNDLPLGDIESIEVVRGPSAATLYGTDAANGVILVRTKQGAGGAARWSAHAEAGVLGVDRGRFPESYYAWGRTPAGAPLRCVLLSVAAGVCAQDSVTAFTPLRDPATTPLGTGRRQAYGVQVSGGAGRTRYLVSGALDDEIGYLKMPEADGAALLPLRGGRPFTFEERRPNGVRRASVRSNVVVPVGGRGELAIAAALVDSRARVPLPSVIFTGVVGTGRRDLMDGWLSSRPGEEFIGRRREDATRFTVGVTGTARPARWLDARLTVGEDYSSSLLLELLPPGESPRPTSVTGLASESRLTTTLRTVDGNLVASRALGAGVTSRSTVGVQYTRRHAGLTGASARDLAPGAATVAGGAAPTVRTGTIESVVAGAYAEQTVGVRERLFLTGALRADGASSFGAGFRTALYPKGSVSWVLSDEPFWPRPRWLSSLRLRAAAGASGVQPGPTAALTTLTVGPAFVDGAVTTGAGLGPLGNAALRPERMREVEGGVDVELFGGAWAAELTRYDKRSRDALVNLALPGSFGALTQWQNVGAVRNWGWEGLVRGTLLDRPAARLAIDVNASVNDNRVLEIAPGIDARYAIGSGSVVRGHPLFSYFDFPIVGYADANGNGILERGEVQVADERAFVARAYPRTQLSATARLALLGGRLALAATADRRGGFSLYNGAESLRCSQGTCAAVSLRDAPLAEQAAALAAQTAQLRNSRAGLIQPADFTRLRELSATVPLGWARRRLGARETALTVAGRNLALWTRYGGADPEVLTLLGDPQRGAFVDNGGLPPARTWVARVNVAF